MTSKPKCETPVHGQRMYGVDSKGREVTHIFFKLGERFKGCWVHENVFYELCYRRGVKDRD